MRPTPAEYIRRTRESYEKLGFEPYRWFQAETEPAFTTPSKPLAESRLGMISTAGTYVQGQVAYYYKDDTGVRAIPNDTPMDKIRFSHIMENYLVEAHQDPATVFPWVNARERGKLDHRSPRTTTPQYQTEEDRLMAEAEKPQMDGIRAGQGSR